jgi:hypothetical protein
MVDATDLKANTINNITIKTLAKTTLSAYIGCSEWLAQS